jgi:hypothetical protein
MSDFHAQLIRIAEMMGATEVRVEGMGTRESGGFKRHPHISGIIGDRPFKHPLPGTFRDTPRRRLNYIAQLRRHLLCIGGTRSKPQQSNGERRERKRVTTPAMPSRPIPPALPPTRLDCDPWAPLAQLRAKLEGRRL